MPLLRGLIAGGVRNPVLVNLLMACILVGGFMAARGLLREAYPEFSLDYIEVRVAYPGASTEDVERSICIPVEEAVAGIDEVREVSSVASENSGSIWLALHTREQDPERVLKEVRDRVDQITSFPVQAEEPIVCDTILRAEVINVAIYGDAVERTLKRVARDVKNDLIALPGISQVTLSGVRDDEIIIELSEEALRAYRLTFDEVMAAIARGSLDLPAGTIQTAEEELTLRVAGQRFTAADYENLIVIDRPDALVRLGDVADVREGFAEGISRGRFNSQPAVVVSVYKTRQQDTTKIARSVREYVQRRQAMLPDRLKMAVWADNSLEVSGRIEMLLTNGIAGIILVFLTLTLFLELRLAFWVTVGLPMAFAGALVVLSAMGETINMVSLFALLMTSGIIVDDAIVIAESIHTRQQRLRQRSLAGETPELACIEGTQRVALPVLGSSLTTIITFIPLLFIVGVMGKFIHVLPVVVIAAIAFSAVEAFGVLPSHLCRRVPLGVAAKPTGPNKVRRFIDRMIQGLIQQWYRPAFRAAMGYRMVTVSLATAALLVAGGLVVSGRTAFVFFPKEDGNILRTRVRLLEGMPASAAQQTIERLEAAAWALNDDPQLVPAAAGLLVAQVYSIAGEFAAFPPQRGNNLCEVQIELMPAQRRRINQEEIIRRWRERIGQIPDATLFTITRQQLGPTDRPIAIRLLGPDLADLEEAAQRTCERLRQYEGVTEAYHDLIPGKRELQVNLKPAARALGLTLRDVATQLRQGFFGGEAVRVQRNREEVVVRVRYPADERHSISQLEAKHFRTAFGEEIPFHEAVDVSWTRGYASVRHQNGERRITLYADLDEREANAEQILRDLEARYLPDLVSEYRDVSFVFAGNREEMDRSLGSLFSGFKVAIIAVYAVLAGMLRSYIQPVVILVAVPFGAIGAVAGHALLGYDLTLMSLFGVVALSGVVVNDSLVLLDHINGSIREGKPVIEAVLTAGEARFKAVTLTSLTTVAGLAPLLMERSSQAQSVLPMAIALVFGILFATVLTLFVVPALYLIVNDLRRFFRWLRRGGPYPTAELVEEAARDNVE